MDTCGLYFLFPPHYGNQTICLFPLKGTNPFWEPVSSICTMDLIDPNWSRQYLSFTWRILMRTALNGFALYKPCLSLFSSEHNLSCCLNLYLLDCNCPSAQINIFHFLLKPKCFLLTKIIKIIKKIAVITSWKPNFGENTRYL